MEATFTISDISEKTGLSLDTIRYYEKIGLMPPAKRKENGQREYDKLDLDRFTFVTHLKRTNMPLKEIERYLTCSAAKDFEGCYRVLYEHKLHIEEQMEDMTAALGKMNYKLEYFQDMIKRSGLMEQ
jgi:DNA-binding transcriptional MerR regulator